MIWISLFSFLMLFYIYLGYFLLLKLLARNNPVIDYTKDSHYIPTVTVLITVFNEVDAIIPKIENILQCDYPAESLEVLIASDGSNDGTDRLVSEFNDCRVRLFRPALRVGKSDTQNQAVEIAQGEVLIFSDADTRFSTKFIKKIVQPFSDLRVGGVDGHLLFLSEGEGGISQGQGFYWDQELKIRLLESKLGILSVGSGACLGIRRSLFNKLDSAVGEDCLLPLSIVSQGSLMIHESSAIAYDRMPENRLNEFNTRVRMTQRNWLGTWMFPNLLNPFNKPMVAFALLSHKILRWLSPLFLINWLVFSLLIFINPVESSLSFFSWISVTFLVISFIGAVANRFGINMPIAGLVYGFCLANSGFFIGVSRAIFGKKIIFYK
jgi:cellulose synthase/poly-beta-1,6-N-acetylglucosamine synthase-like glycosyltransferase